MTDTSECLAALEAVLALNSVQGSRYCLELSSVAATKRLMVNVCWGGGDNRC
jgi:hypothetical protein